MGLFDFLHGARPPKSEAEMYMEKRNKEYARKAAEYRRREAVNSVTERLGDSIYTIVQENMRKNTRNTDGVQTLGSVFGTAVCSILENFGIKASGPKRQQNGNTQNKSKILVSTTHTTASAKYAYDCDQCGSTSSIYDEMEIASFLVSGASVQSSTKALNVVGEIQRGSFKIGDRVEVVTALEVNSAKIAFMFRKGEPIDYANASAGMITLVFDHMPSVVRGGDKIVKTKR
jgi:hypothetical protein